MSIASAVLALSKTASRLSAFLLRLDGNELSADDSLKNLAVDVQSLARECDSIFIALKELMSKHKSQVPPHNEIDSKVWSCLATVVQATSRTIQQTELVAKNIAGYPGNITTPSQHEIQMGRGKDQIACMQTEIYRHNRNLHAMRLLTNMTLRTPQGQEIAELQDLVEKLHTSSKSAAQPQLSCNESTLVKCAQELVAKCRITYEPESATRFGTSQQALLNYDVQVSEWVNTLDSNRHSDQSDVLSDEPSVFSDHDRYTFPTSATPDSHISRKEITVTGEDDGFDDDWDTDLAQAALDAGMKAFNLQDWKEAESLLREALHVLQQLHESRRTFSDMFLLEFKIALCAYHTQEATTAAKALLKLSQQPTVSDEQRICVFDALHLLSLLYIRMGQTEQAQTECKKALQARRKLLGKQSDAALESTALMSHIYVLLDNRARATSCLAMLPENKRDTILKRVGESLGLPLEHVNPVSPTVSRSELPTPPIQSAVPMSPFISSMNSDTHGSATATPSQTVNFVPQRPHLRSFSNQTSWNSGRSFTVRSNSSTEDRGGSSTANDDSTSRYHAVCPEVLGITMPPLATRAKAATSQIKPLARAEILNNIGCKPRDSLEDAVCDGNHTAFTSILEKKLSSWRSKFRKPGQPERVTALHYAALFGEIHMAQCLLTAGFNINEIPFGYTTKFSPLKFAVGARQVAMVEYLTANGARPSEPDTWSTLAGQLMNRSWLMKTISEPERDTLATRIVAIMRILLKHGWNIDEPYDDSGKTVLHQAVTFWTGSYSSDLKVRTTVTSFLTEQGADAFRANAEGKAPYEMALASGHHELLLILDRAPKKTERMDPGMILPVELPG
ncbi:hypothetical protein LTR64_005207 [Lithohypha guttulata]|uniref:uncharacterized protein n=1 Tax=Lithohypha guttulata TaxID=1690604 RepID=UPI00315DDD13